MVAAFVMAGIVSTTSNDEGDRGCLGGCGGTTKNVGNQPCALLTGSVIKFRSDPEGRIGHRATRWVVHHR